MWPHLKDIFAAHKLPSNQTASNLHVDGSNHINQADAKFNQNVLFAKQDAKGVQSNTGHHDAFSWIGRHWEKSKTVLQQCFKPEPKVISNTEIEHPAVRTKRTKKRHQNTSQNSHKMQNISTLKQSEIKCKSSLFLPSINNYKENQNSAKQGRASKNFQGELARKNMHLHDKNRSFKRKVISTSSCTKNNANCNNNDKNDKTTQNINIFSQKSVFNRQLLQKRAKSFTQRCFPNKREPVKERMVPALKIRDVDFYTIINTPPPYWSLSRE
jgi:hypothetical protein